MSLLAARFKNQPVLEACAAGTHRMTIGEPAEAAVRLVQQALLDLGLDLPLHGSADVECTHSRS